MKTKIIFRIATIILFFILILTAANSAFAGGAYDRNAFENISSPIDGKVENIAVQLISAFRIGAVAIALTIILVIAMKYMISSAGDRADIKKHAVAYVAGTVILFGMSAILGVIQDLATKISASE